MAGVEEGSAAAQFAAAAASMIGTPFRLHGRDPASGLDCVGLVYASLAAIGRRPLAPNGYSLRNRSITGWLRFAALNGLAPVTGTMIRGDVLLVQPSSVQHHLLIAADHGSAIHAHAGLGKVVRQPFNDRDSVRAHWRIAAPDEG